MLAEFDQELQQGCSLGHNCGAVSSGLHKPGLRADGTAVADEDGTVVVLVRVIDGPLDDVSRDADVCWVEDKAFTVNDVVVSEVRDSTMTRLAIVILSV